MTLMEALVSATIVLLVLLSLLGTIAFGLNGTQNAEGNQRAVLFARRLFELIRERRLAQTVGFNDPVTARIPLETPLLPPPPGESPQVDFPPGTGYSRRIVTSRLSTDSSDYKSKVFQIEVFVFWRVKSRENSFHLIGYDRAP